MERDRMKQQSNKIQIQTENQHEEKANISATFNKHSYSYIEYNVISKRLKQTKCTLAQPYKPLSILNHYHHRCTDG